jgi:GTP-binding protein
MPRYADDWRPAGVRFLGSFPKTPPQTGLPEVAFAGRSNVGKSSAINAILGRKAAARVSKTPGRTQAINLFEIDARVVFADLPGYGYAKVPEAVQDAWKGAIENYLAGRKALRLVVALVDGRLPPQKLDVALIGGLRAAEISHLVVATKVDKLKRNRRLAQLTTLRKGLGVPASGFVSLSSPKRVGVGEIWRRLDKACV